MQSNCGKNAIKPVAVQFNKIELGKFYDSSDKKSLRPVIFNKTQFDINVNNILEIKSHTKDNKFATCVLTIDLWDQVSS